ncbi:glycoside hydrolase family 16 protein [Paraburkholderia sp. J12]|uniref:glycoside hydrolase family 16 protein n=1 Tax=Paraburkholderia sp. J12 TaxID=2805432 RepID=UPI002ABD88ED|nr:glycoside hydrolase family 16 protein [Paraburkholderia sp. J12]
MKVLLFLVLLLGVHGNSFGQGERLNICRYRLVFSEDFHDFRIAPRELGNGRWTAHTPWNGDFGDASFADPGPDGPFSIVDGELHITARRSESGRWASGLMAAADASGRGEGVKYGYFEAKMRMPPGPGTWPAFWLASLKPVGEQVPGVEIDVVEYYGHDDTNYMSALHVWYPGNQQDQSRHVVHANRVVPGSLVDGYHTYGVLIEPAKITYFLDRVAVWDRPTPPEYRFPMYPIVNLALGSGYPISDTPNPSVLKVKYVRLYTPLDSASCVDQ